MKELCKGVRQCMTEDLCVGIRQQEKAWCTRARQPVKETCTGVRIVKLL